MRSLGWGCSFAPSHTMRTILMMTLAAGFAFAAPVPKERKKGSSIYGTWKLVETNGQIYQPLETWALTEDGKMTVNNNSIYNYKLDFNKSPAHLEYCLDGQTQGQVTGIFDVEGDVMRFRYGILPNIPTNFDSVENLYKFERVKD
jgi:hypothetical protein